MDRARGRSSTRVAAVRIRAVRLRAVRLAAALLLAACAPGEEGEPRAPADDTSPAAAPVCLQGDPFVADGPVHVRAGEPGDANEVGDLRWQPYDGCERFVIDLRAPDGSAAGRAGDVGAELLRDLGVVRVSIRDVEQVDTDATDAAFDGPLITAAYAVREAEGGWIHVDIHLGRAAEAHVAVLDDPARVVVDVRPGGPELPTPAARERHVVLLEPRPGPASYPLTVTGYARTFEANVVARLERNGEEAFEDFTTATDYIGAWGHFSLTIPTGPTGPVVLHVGEYSAKDGSWAGAAVELEMR